MKSKKLYNTLKKLTSECIDDIGLPKKPTVTALYEASQLCTKYEYEIKEKERLMLIETKAIADLDPDTNNNIVYKEFIK